MPNNHLQRHPSGHLTRHPSGHLQFRTTWLSRSVSYFYGSAYVTAQSAYTLENINRSPLPEWQSVRAQALANFAYPGNGSYAAASATVGGSYDWPGSAKASCCIVGKYAKYTPYSTIGNIYHVRVLCNVATRMGVFSSVPTNSQMFTASIRTPVGGYIDLDDYLEMFRDSQSSGSPIYISAINLPEETPTISTTQQSVINDTGSADDWYGFTLQPGETLYWKTGSWSGAPATPVAPQLSFKV